MSADHTVTTKPATIKPTKTVKRKRKKKARPVGRPSSYKKIYAKQIVEFFKRLIKSHELPAFSKFAHHIGVNTDTLHEWRNCGKHPEFSDSFKECNNITKAYLIDGAVDRRFDSPFTKWLLINNHGMKSDKLVTENNSHVTTDININFK